MRIYVRMCRSCSGMLDVTLRNASNCACMMTHLYMSWSLRTAESEEDSVNEGREESASVTGPSGLGGELEVNTE